MNKRCTVTEYELFFKNVWFNNLFSGVSKHQSDTQMVTSYNPEEFSTRKEETDETHKKCFDAHYMLNEHTKTYFVCDACIC